MKKSLRVILIGCVESSKEALLALQKIDKACCNLVGVMTKKKSVFNSDFVDLSPLVTEESISVLYYDDSELTTIDWLRK